MSGLTAWELLHSRPCPVLRFGCKALDSLLGGGLRPGITEIAGEAGSGKSQFGLQLLLQVQLPVGLGGLDGAAFFLSTEGEFPVKRLQQMEEGVKRRLSWTKDFNFFDNVYVHQADSLEEQHEILFTKLSWLMQQKNIRLIVIDSIAALYRAEYGEEDTVKRASQFFELTAHLRSLSEKFAAPVLIINQVTDVFEEDARPVPAHVKQWAVLSSGRKIIPCLGLAWSSCINTRLFLSRTRVLEPNEPESAVVPTESKKHRPSPTTVATETRRPIPSASAGIRAVTAVTGSSAAPLNKENCSPSQANQQQPRLPQEPRESRAPVPRKLSSPADLSASPCSLHTEDDVPVTTQEPAAGSQNTVWPLSHVRMCEVQSRRRLYVTFSPYMARGWCHYLVEADGVRGEPSDDQPDRGRPIRSRHDQSEAESEVSNEASQSS